jgi:hypothetical protein
MAMASEENNCTLAVASSDKVLPAASEIQTDLESQDPARKVREVL